MKQILSNSGISARDEIKKRLQDVLVEYGSNPTQLARLFKVNQKTLNNQVNGDTDVSVSTILLFLDAFKDLSTEWLLRGRGDMRLLPDGLPDVQDVEIGKLEEENKNLKILLADRDLQILKMQTENQANQKRAVG
ncbi:MAG: hypothetical protein J5957_10105 [Prevotella sp.]|nr:hypothetical protein [Prevotella sp.]